MKTTMMMIDNDYDDFDFVDGLNQMELVKQDVNSDIGGQV